MRIYLTFVLTQNGIREISSKSLLIKVKVLNDKFYKKKQLIRIVHNTNYWKN